jgi:hypothetical protein
MHFAGTAFFQGADEVMKGAERAYPAAEYSAQQNGYEDERKREEKGRRDFLSVRGEDGGNKNDGIKVQEKSDRITERIVSFGFRLHEEEKEEEKEKTL